MDTFKKTLLGTKTIAVWGLGYLGYTTILRLQNEGFSAITYDFNKERTDALLKGSYPRSVQREAWSKNAELPVLDMESVTVAKEPKALLSAPVQIIAFPARGEDGEDRYAPLVQLFIENREALKDSLILFQSADRPGTTEQLFIEPLKSAGISCAIAAAFRSDWTIEAFLAQTTPRILACEDLSAEEKAGTLFRLFGISCRVVTTIEEAEVLESAKNSFQYVTTAFFNQLALSFPSLNVRELVPLLVRSLDSDESMPSIGSLSYKVANSIGNLSGGTTVDSFLTLIGEAESTNLSMVIHYSDLLNRNGVETVAILGIGEYGTFKDTRVSPSVMLAEYLDKQGIRVVINDPHFSREELESLLPFATCADLGQGELSAQAIILMNDQKAYRSLTSLDLKKIGFFEASIIIDAVGILKEFSFPDSVLYHIPGDGRLRGLEC